jgi:hypothetical protein
MDSRGRSERFGVMCGRGKVGEMIMDGREKVG